MSDGSLGRPSGIRVPTPSIDSARVLFIVGPIMDVIRNRRVSSIFTDRCDDEIRFWNVKYEIEFFIL